MNQPNENDSNNYQLPIVTGNSTQNLQSWNGYNIEKQETEQINQPGSTGYQAGSMTVNNIMNLQPRNKSMIAEVVNILSSLPVIYNFSNQAIAIPAEIRTKIDHNNLNRCRYIIELYKNNVIDLQKAYNTLEEEKSGRKDLLMFSINNFYNQELSKIVIDYSKKMEFIRAKSDEIFENVIKKLCEEVFKSSNLNAYNEDVYFAVNLIAADAFIECKLLENPKDSK